MRKIAFLRPICIILLAISFFPLQFSIRSASEIQEGACACCVPGNSVDTIKFSLIFFVRASAIVSYLAS